MLHKILYVLLTHFCHALKHSLLAPSLLSSPGAAATTGRTSRSWCAAARCAATVARSSARSSSTTTTPIWTFLRRLPADRPARPPRAAHERCTHTPLGAAAFVDTRAHHHTVQNSYVYPYITRPLNSLCNTPSRRSQFSLFTLLHSTFS